MPMTSHVFRAPVLLAALAFPAIALPHHGWSGYDSNIALKVAGTISEAGYEHPHGYVKLDTPGKTWLVVLAPPSRMENRGLPPSALKAGMTAQVEGYPNRTDPGEMRAAVPAGFMMFTAHATEFAGNPAFLLKLGLLAVAAANVAFFHLLPYRSVRVWDVAGDAPHAARIAAALSIVVWIAVISCGRLIAYF